MHLILYAYIYVYKAAVIQLGCVIVTLLEGFSRSWEAKKKSVKLSSFEKTGGKNVELYPYTLYDCSCCTSKYIFV